MNTSQMDVAVMGGGLQGCCIALELALRGFHITLIEQDDQVMNRASLRNEGKIHLGIVYANDPTLETALLQLKGALTFGDLIERWTGTPASELGLSTPFDYLVAEDSFMLPRELSFFYDELNHYYQTAFAINPSMNYLGTRPETLAEPLTASYLREHYGASDLMGGFKTTELAVSTEALAQVIQKAIRRNERIHLCAGTRIESVTETKRSIRIDGFQDNGQSVQFFADQVINATWENRLVLDKSFGMRIEPGWVHRLKCRVIVELPPGLRQAPSATMVIGKYGDVVIRPDGTAYLSWYPIAMRGWSHELLPPNSWQKACRGSMHGKDADAMASKVMEAISEWYPGMVNARPLIVDGGAIFAHGKSDVDDPASGLHSRTNVGIKSQGSFHSINPGKLTTAPFFAIEAANIVSETKPDGLGYLDSLFI